MSNENGSQALTAAPMSMGMPMMPGMTPAMMEAVAKQFMVQMSRVQMALAMRRDVAEVQSKLLEYCKNPDFAKAAVYAKPVGGSKKHGLSARFAEAAMPVMRNLDESTVQIYDDIEKQTWRVSVGDLETNTVFQEEVFINKRTWRKSLRQGQDYIATRPNNNGEVIYLVEATDDEVNTLRAALCSKVRRNLIIRHVPPDIRAKCLQLCLKVAEDDDAKDPDAARKQIVDSFLKMGIGVDELALYLGHSVRAISETELSELRGVYVVIRDGESTWADLLAEKQAALVEAKKSGGLNKVKERVRKTQEAREKKEQKKGDAEKEPQGQGAAAPTQEGAQGGTDAKPEGGRKRASRRRDEAQAGGDEKKETPPGDGQQQEPPTDTTTPAGAGDSSKE